MIMSQERQSRCFSMFFALWFQVEGDGGGTFVSKWCRRGFGPFGVLMMFGQRRATGTKLVRNVHHECHHFSFFQMPRDDLMLVKRFALVCAMKVFLPRNSVNTSNVKDVLWWSGRWKIVFAFLEDQTGHECQKHRQRCCSHACIKHENFADDVVAEVSQ